MNESIDQPINRSPTPRPTHPHPHSRSPIVAVVVIVIESDVTSAAIVVIVALSSSPASLSLSSSSRRRRHHRHCRHRHHRVLCARCPADIYIHIFTYMFIGSTAFGYAEVVGKYVRANTSKLGGSALCYAKKAFTQTSVLTVIVFHCLHRPTFRAPIPCHA